MATLDDILDANESAGAALDKVVVLLERLTEAGQKAAGGGGGAGGGLGALGFFKKAATVATAATAAITGAAFAASAFVKALNPALVSQFVWELGNLRATIGSALEPVIANAIPVVKQLAGVALELADEMRPLIDEVSSAVGNVLVSVVRQLAVQLKAVLAVAAPLLKAASWLANVFSQLADVQTAAMQALAQTLGELLTSVLPLDDMKGVLDVFLQQVGNAALGLGYLTAQALKLVGANETLDKFRKNLAKIVDDRKNPKGGLMQAPQGATTGGIEDIARRFAEKAFVATSGAKAKETDVDILNKILEGLGTGTMDPQTLEDRIKAALSDFFPKLTGASYEDAGRFVNAVYDRSATTGDRWRDAPGTLSGIGAVGIGAVGDLVDWALR